MSSKKTSSKKTKATKKKDKVENLQVADGKNDIEKIKNLEDLLGVKQTNPFGTTNKEVLEERMNEIPLMILQTLR